MSDFEVHIPDESSMHDFLVAFPGPADSELHRGTLDTCYRCSLFTVYAQRTGELTGLVLVCTRTNTRIHHMYVHMMFSQIGKLGQQQW